MNSVWSIVNGIAWKHGIANPKVLEGGSYPPHQVKTLRKMGKKCLKSLHANDFHRYIQQKAKFLTNN